MADHKTTGGIDMTTERVKSIALLAAQLFAAVQTGLSLAGLTALPFTTDQVSTAITGVLTALLAVYSWWRSNPVTLAGATGKQLTRAIKAGTMEVATTANTIETVTGTPVEDATDEDIEAAFARVDKDDKKEE